MFRECQKRYFLQTTIKFEAMLEAKNEWQVVATFPTARNNISRNSRVKLRPWLGATNDRSMGCELFRKACEFGLEGLVSKHRDGAYRAGTSPNWVKVKNPQHPAMTRVMQAFREDRL
jgi:hypothetical protein